ncbi:hypothetical protein HK101_007966 [Irineochytrium annulatum]|nr:hypothetical protein HK101_007966 [Irineochytrium annulatum]
MMTHASEGAMQFLVELGEKGVCPEFLFTDRLPLYEKLTARPVGQTVVIIREGVEKGKPCYFVSVNTEAKMSSTTSYSNTLTAYVTASLETISQSVFEVAVTSECTTERVMEVTTLADGHINVSESVTDKDDTSFTFAPAQVRGLILDGAQRVLFRALARAKTFQLLWLLTYTDGLLHKRTYNIQPNVSRQSALQEKTNLTKVSTAIDRSASSVPQTADGRGGRLGLRASTMEAVSVTDLVRRAREDDGFNDNLEDIKYEAYFFSSGQCAYMISSHDQWEAEVTIKHEEGICML